MTTRLLAGPTCDRLLRLADDGLDDVAIATALGVSRGKVTGIRYGKTQTVSPDFAAAVRDLANRMPATARHSVDDLTWQEHAACRGVDPETFFPEQGGSFSEAKGTCAICPVAGDCHAYAIRTKASHGIWGGHNVHRKAAS